MKSRDQALKKFQNFKAFAENKHGKTIKRVRSDNGREYINKIFENFLKKNGITHELSAPSPTERRNRKN